MIHERAPEHRRCPERQGCRAIRGEYAVLHRAGRAPGPRRVGAFGTGNGGGALLSQMTACGNVPQRDPESLMNYAG